MLLPTYGIVLSSTSDFAAIARGELTAAVVPKSRDYIEGGDLVLACHTSLVPWAAMAEITAVRHRLLKDVSRSEWMAAGYVCQDEMFQMLKIFNAALGPESEVTVVRWTNIRGQVINAQRARDKEKPH